MLLNSDPELGHGIAGYGRYYWRTFTDGVSGTLFTEAIVPAITHEDPRYYTMGTGGFFRRTGCAISCAFVTKTDSGGTSFKWSELAGNELEAALSNPYYPPQERGLSQTAGNWGTQMESAVLKSRLPGILMIIARVPSPIAFLWPMLYFASASPRIPNSRTVQLRA